MNKKMRETTAGTGIRRQRGWVMRWSWYHVKCMIYQDSLAAWLEAEVYFGIIIFSSLCFVHPSLVIVIMVLLRISAFVFGLLALGVTAVPFPEHHARRLDTRAVPDTHALHERAMPHWGRKWEKSGRVSSNTILPMRIGLKQANLDKGHDLLMDM